MMIILERPKLYEGVYKRVLDKILRSSEITPEEVYVTYLVRCEPPKKPTKAQINACKTWLWREMKAVMPRVIATFGQGPTSLLQKGVKVDDVVELDYLPGTKLAAFESFWKLYQGPTSRLCEVVSTLEELKNAR